MLGLWVQRTEGARFWNQVLTELRNRGVRDVLIARCDGLAGLPEAIESTWPQAVVQTCVVHLIRASLRYVSYNDRKAVAAAFKPIYTAVNADAASDELTAFADTPLGKKYGATVAAWERACDRFVPFLAFAPEIREITYTTNSIKSLNYHSARSSRTVGRSQRRRRHQAALGGDPRHREQTSRRPGQGERCTPQRSTSTRTPHRRRHHTHGWRAAINALDLTYPGRLPAGL